MFQRFDADGSFTARAEVLGKGLCSAKQRLRAREHWGDRELCLSSEAGASKSAQNPQAAAPDICVCVYINTEPDALQARNIWICIYIYTHTDADTLRQKTHLARACCGSVSLSLRARSMYMRTLGWSWGLGFGLRVWGLEFVV